MHARVCCLSNAPALLFVIQVAGEHAWRRGNWFVPLEELDGDDQQVTIFRTKRAAQEEVRRQRKRIFGIAAALVRHLPEHRIADAIFADLTAKTFDHTREINSHD